VPHIEISGVVLVNNDDDNHNGTNDVNEPLSGPDSVVNGENELTPIWLAPLEFTNGTIVTFSVQGYGGIRVWKSVQRGPDGPVLDNVSSSNLILSTNYLSEAFPMMFFVEGASASRTNDDVVFYVQALGSCINSAKVTVVDIASTVWEAADSPLTNNAALGGPGGGLAIFPDKPTLASGGDYQVLRVKATVVPAVPDVPVYFTSFDVRDPTHTMPLVDVTATTVDNPCVPQAGTLSPGSAWTDASGVADNYFTVTMQPGDNFRVVAGCDPNFASQYHSDVNSTTGGIVDTNGNPIAWNHVTDMLTVWRRLHVEVDSMEAVPPGANLLMNTMYKCTGNASGTTRITLTDEVNDGSPDLDGDPNCSGARDCMGNGRFENGKLRIGTGSPSVLISPITGNGDDWVTFPSAAIVPLWFHTEDNDIFLNGTMDGTVTEIVNSEENPICYLNVTAHNQTPIDWQDFVGGKLVVGGGEPVMITNADGTAATLTTSTLDVPVSLVDDDDNSILPHVPVIGAEFKALYSKAYILPIVDGGGNPANNSTSVPFVLNVPASLFESVLTSANALQADSNRADDFWIGYALISFQSSAVPEQLGLPSPRNPPRGDYDPNSEPNVPGLNGGGPDSRLGAMLYMEPIRETGVQGSEQRIIAHEIAHQFGVDDTYIAGSSPEDDIMGDGTYFNGSHFYPEAIRVLRSKIQSPGR
jgi:hypothetical protein